MLEDSVPTLVFKTDVSRQVGFFIRTVSCVARFATSVRSACASTAR